MAQQVYDPEDLKKAEERPYRSQSLPTSTSSGKVKYSTNKPQKSNPGDLSTSTSDGDVSYDHSDDIPEAESSLYNSSATKPGRFRLGNYIRANPRKSAAGGGIVATIVGLTIFFSIASGPFEFIHIAQLLERFHFTGLQNQEDDRFLKEARLFRYMGKGEVEKTRLGFLGNKFGDRFEAKLNGTGLASSYSDTFGLFDGYAVDRSSDKFKGMTDDEIKQYIKETYGVEPVDGSSINGGSKNLKGKLVIDATKLGYVDNYKMTYGMLREAGYSKLSSAIGARYLCQRAACTSMLHPLSKKVSSGKRSLEDWWNKRNVADREGSNTPELGTGEDSNAQNDKTKKGNADSVKAEAESDKSLSAKEISAKLGGTGAAVAGVLCIAKGVAADAHNLKASQIQVLTRMAIESMGLASQIQSGQDVNLNQLAKYNDLLNGVDSSGKTTNWDEAQSIQSNLGKDNAGFAPNKTLQGVTNDSTPFDFLNTSQPLATILGGVCSTAGQIIMFLGGGLEGLVQAAVLAGVQSQFNFTQYLADWLAGNAVNVDAVGADFGSEIDYGAALAANSQAMLAGGTALDSTSAAANQSVVNTVAQEQFDRQSLIYRLFSPYDQQSMISKVIDSANPNPTKNIAKIGSALINFRGAFASIASILGGSAKAADTGYNYGFPIYGFSQAEMTDSKYENPYDNICHIFGCVAENTKNSQPITGFITGSTDASQPATPSGQLLLNRVKTCFGAQISQVQGQTDDGVQTQWNVKSAGNELPNPYDDKYPSYCKNPPEKELVDDWTRLRFFIMDTETMNSMSCYEGDDQACSDIGFDTSSDISASPGVTSGSGAVDEGTNAALAQRILDYQKTGQYNCDNPGDCTDLQKIVDGQSLAGSDGCQAQTLDPRVLKLILYMIESGFKIGTFALCGDHSDDGSGGHSGGFAVDISSINGLALNQDTPAVAAAGVQLDKFLNNLPDSLKLDQQISYGYGNHYYQPMAALQQAQGKLCLDTCVSFYTQATEDVHTNHIHAGY